MAHIYAKKYANLERELIVTHWDGANENRLEPLIKAVAVGRAHVDYVPFQVCIASVRYVYCMCCMRTFLKGTDALKTDVKGKWIGKSSSRSLDLNVRHVNHCASTCGTLKRDWRV